jgi:flavin-dependent dehydrogenase
VAIIGGSLAGSACVRLLTRAGIAAVAIERDVFPREKVCGGFLSPGAVAILDELDVLEPLRHAGAAAVHSARVRTPGRISEIRFRRPGLGASRRLLDAVLADHPAVEQGNVVAVERQAAAGFQIRLSSGETIAARVAIDASGKLSRFAAMQPSPQFGVQFYNNEAQGSESPGDVMDFYFFSDGYGGTVRIEGQRSNSCFLVRREALHRYMGKPQCRVTGPLSYRSRHNDFMAIGDAAAMIDPFCGEGMHHALDTGRLAAEAVIDGFDRGSSYGEMRQRYENERGRRWTHKRALARAARTALQFPRLRGAAFGMKLDRLLDWFWS